MATTTDNNNNKNIAGLGSKKSKSASFLLSLAAEQRQPQPLSSTLSSPSSSSSSPSSSPLSSPSSPLPQQQQQQQHRPSSVISGERSYTAINSNGGSSSRGLGGTGLRRTLGTPSLIYEEQKRDLLFPRAAKTYKEMSTEAPVIASILYLCNSAIRSLGWTVEGPDESDDSKRAVEFIEQNLDGLAVPWSQVIEEALSVLIYGFCFLETIYKPNYYTGLIEWYDFAPRSQSSLAGWKFEGDQCTHFIQYDPALGRTVEIPLSRGVLLNINKTRKNPEGQSLLRSCYIPYRYLQQLQQIEAIGIERALNGFPVITTPETVNLNDDTVESNRIREEVDNMGTGIRNDSIDYVAKPEGWKIELLTPGTTRSVDVDTTIKRYNSQIASSFSANIQDMANAVNASAANVQQSMLNQALQSFVNNIAETFNKHAVEKLLRINGFVGKAELVPCRIKQPTMNELALVLRAMGLNIAGDKELMNSLRALLDVPLMNDELFEEVYLPQAATDYDDGVSHDKLLESREFEQIGED